jgi:hypothetical protein
LYASLKNGNIEPAKVGKLQRIYWNMITLN